MDINRHKGETPWAIERMKTSSTEAWTPYGSQVNYWVIFGIQSQKGENFFDDSKHICLKDKELTLIVFGELFEWEPEGVRALALVFVLGGSAPQTPR